jgi:hypothetical protein
MAPSPRACLSMAVHLNKDELIRTLQKEINYLSNALEDHEQLHKEKERRHLASLNALIKEREQSRRLESSQLDLVDSLQKTVAEAKEARRLSAERSDANSAELEVSLKKAAAEKDLLRAQLEQVAADCALYKERAAETVLRLSESKENYCRMEDTWIKLEKSWRHEKKQLLQELLVQRTADSIKVLSDAKELNAASNFIERKTKNAKEGPTQATASYQKKYENLKKLYFHLVKQLDERERKP